MRNFLLWLNAFVLSYNFDQFLLVYSSDTSLELLSQFKYFKKSINLTDSADPLAFIEDDLLYAIIDITLDSFAFYYLDEICTILEIFYITATQDVRQGFSKFRYYYIRLLS